MYTILNKTERLIHAPNGEMLPPGAAVTVSEDTMNHPQMQTLANEGAIEVTEVQDPPPPETLSGAMAGPRDPVTGVQKVNPETVAGGATEQTKAPPPPPPGKAS